MAQALIDQNHQQAREILIRNPLLTKALFQVFLKLICIWCCLISKGDSDLELLTSVFCLGLAIVVVAVGSKLGFCVVSRHEQCFRSMPRLLRLFQIMMMLMLYLLNVRHKSCSEWFSLHKRYLLGSLKKTILFVVSL